MFVGILGAAEERAGADPGTEQGEDEDEGGQGTAGDQVVGSGVDLAETRERDGEQSEDDEGEDDGVEIHGWLVSTTVYGWVVWSRLRGRGLGGCGFITAGWDCALTRKWNGVLAIRGAAAGVFPWENLCRTGSTTTSLRDFSGGHHRRSNGTWAASDSCQADYG